MNFLPHYNETIVLPFGVSRAMRLLDLHTRSTDGNQGDNKAEIYFNGKVEEDHFRISEMVRKPENFLPLITGRIEGTSRGCIIFVRYTLFFSTSLFLIFWSLVTSFLALYLVFYPGEYIYATISFLAGVVNYVIALVNFGRQVAKSKKTLIKCFL